MKKKCLAMIIGCMLMAGLTACGEEEVKVVSKLPGESNTAEAEEEADQQEAGDEEQQQEEALTGYIFDVDVDGTIVSVTTDVDMKGILEQLGEPASYFEAASCAFQGLDKTYTYEHFRIETYPEGETDKISSIIFLDDIEETQEGISIGMTEEDMKNTYGKEYEENGAMVIYTKDGKHLSFLIKDDVIESIEYNSAVLDSTN